MHLDLEALAILDAINRSGGFNAAAHELKRSASTITYAIQKLERELGVELFVRNGRNAILTTAGHLLLEEGRHLLRNAQELSDRVKRAAMGWEMELRIAVDEHIAFVFLLPVLNDFFALGRNTRLSFATEVYNGSWDAIASQRADIAIGAPADGPSTGGYNSSLMGEVELAFVVTPGHPLARLADPLSRDDIRRYRAVTVADSTRTLPPRTIGVLPGQEVITVPNFQAKLEAHRLGLGVGYLHRSIAEKEQAAGRLIICPLKDSAPKYPLFLVWRTDRIGKAMDWFINKLTEPDLVSSLLRS